MAMTDEDQLDLLGMFYYVLGGLEMCFVLIPLIFIVMGAFLVVAPNLGDMPSQQGEAEAAMFGGAFFIFVGLVIAALIGAKAGCMIYAGRCLRSRRNRMFAMVMGALTCLSFPVGTALGVFTLVVLSRPEVQALYERPPVMDYQ